MADKILWRPLLILLLIWLATLNSWYWLWGIIILILTVHDLKQGRTSLIDKLTRHSNPVLYWLSCISWLLIAVLLITHSG